MILFCVLKCHKEKLKGKVSLAEKVMYMEWRDATNTTRIYYHEKQHRKCSRKKIPIRIIILLQYENVTNNSI